MTTTTANAQKTIAIFGAGTGLGASVAARFGRQGYRVALVARRPAPLQELATELGHLGVEASAFPADLTEIAAIPALVRSIEAKLGRIDVAVHAPLTTGFVPAVELDAAKLMPLASLLTFSAIEVAHAVLPGMLARGDGAIVIGCGLSAVHAMPGLSGLGPAMAAARNYAFGLNAEVKDRGLYAGTITIGAVIQRSAGQRAMAAAGTLDPRFPTVDPDEIAEEVWRLVTRRDRSEAILPPPAPELRSPGP